MDTENITFSLKPEAARLLAGRKALVTGADSGIGQGIATAAP